jgi:CcmD family protein
MDPRNFQYMFYGFSVAWLLIVVFAFSMLVRERKIKAEIDRLKSMMAEKERR